MKSGIKEPIVKGDIKQILTIILAIISLSGCATAKKAPPPQTVSVTLRVFNSPYDSVWKTIVDVLTHANFEIKSLNKNLGIIRAETTRLGNFYNFNMADYKKYVELPRILFARWTEARCGLNFKLTRISNNKTEVRIRLAFELYETNTTGVWHQCGSKGVFETEVFRVIATKQ
jgi:hypothetical protein